MPGTRDVDSRVMLPHGGDGGDGSSGDATGASESEDKENQKNARYLEIAASISEVRHWGRVCQASPKGGSSVQAAKLIRRTRRLEMQGPPAPLPPPPPE